MARVYKHVYAGGRKSTKWYLEYRDASGRLRRVPGSTDKKASQIMLADLVKREERIRCGIIDPQESGGAMSLASAEEDFSEYLTSKGNTAQHVREVRRYLRIVAAATGWALISDLRALDAERYLSRRLKPLDKKEKALSFDAYNHYRAALISFGNWLMKVRRAIPANPFSGISRRNPHENPVHPRRTLAAEEFAAFLGATRNGPDRFELSGADREMLYLVAACSGLRAAALAGLTAKQFDLGSKTPILHATASLQKNRKAHAIPLPGFLAERLRPWISSRVGKLWPGNWARWNSSTMVYRDLKAAGIEPETSEGWFDFHALRHQYATMLVDSGATPAEVQQLLDHSTPALTARYFRHLTTDRLAVPVERLPKMG